MNDLNDFLEIVSEGKKELENVTKQTEIILNPPKLSSLFDNLKGDSFLSILESEIKTEKEKEKKQKKIDKINEKEFLSIFQSKEEKIEIVEEESIPEIESIFEHEIIPIMLEEVSEESIPEITEELLIIEATKQDELLNPATYDKLFKTNVDLFNQPKLQKVNPEMKAITDKLQYMENWLTKVSMAGPGGGEVNLRWLDDVDRSTIYDMRFLRYSNTKKKFEFAEVNPHDIVYTTHLVTTSSYNIDSDDYYVGVNYAGPTTITLPTTLLSSGRTVIIKDESGAAETNPITVVGTVDNDAGGFIIQINNGATQLIYRDGWRII